MQTQQKQQGVTLIELLVVIAILGLILAGLYQLLQTAHQMYLETRALVESQQTARVVLDYLSYRLREIDGGGTLSLGANPTRCTDCHQPNLDNSAADDPGIPCARDVLVPRRNVFLDNLTTLNLTALANIPADYRQAANGNNKIVFWADLLPQTGISDTFIDSPKSGTNSSKRNGKWDLYVDNDSDGNYDPGEGDREIVFIDINDNGKYDYYGEKWTLELQKPAGKNFYELVETLSFENFTSKNKSTYGHDSSGVAYTKKPVAYGITSLDIRIVEKNLTKLEAAFNSLATYEQANCSDSGCHDDVFGSKTDFDYAKFVKKHSFNGTARASWWNVKGFSIEVATTDPTGKKFIKMKQFVIPRNLEVNR